MKMIEPEEVRRVLGLADPDRLIVTGGQALNLWAERYHQAPELLAYAPYMSKDVDFCGRYSDAAELAKKLGGYMEKPSADGIQPWMEGIIVVPQEGGDDLRIDILNHVLGTEPKDVEKSSIRVHLHSLHTGQKLTANLMHPFHVLQSRIANVIGIAGPNAPEHSSRKRQAKAAPVILREYLREMSS
jgi:bifunctional DNA-binding transcriptional regulator/antitoxin component of YhaV-PrlF toxin-antitoxin module